MLQVDLRSGSMVRKMRAITPRVKPMTGFWLFRYDYGHETGFQHSRKRLYAATIMTTPPPSNLKAAFWMTGWITLMLTMAVVGREVTREIDPFQVMELRALIGIVLIYPLVYMHGGLKTMRTGYPVRHLGRNIVHYGAQYSWFVALGLIPLAQVISIEFTMPIWTAILAVVFLGERMNAWKIAAIVFGIVGVLIIVRPEAGRIDPGQAWALASSVGFAVSVVMIKSLTRTDSVVRILFWMLVIQAIIGAIPAYLVWQPVPTHLWGFVLAVAFCGTFSHYCMTRAMLYADATVVVPMDFIRVPATAIIGWLIYAEGIDMFTVTGATLILVGNLLNLRQAGTARVR
jgi:drug/metabolite transporter (DMT)-like permease